jgi:hypothetical protein
MVFLSLTRREGSFETRILPYQQVPSNVDIYTESEELTSISDFLLSLCLHLVKCMRDGVTPRMWLRCAQPQRVSPQRLQSEWRAAAS